MNRYETNTTGTMANAAPLFASSWLALFYVLRDSFNERKSAGASDDENSTPMEEK